MKSCTSCFSEGYTIQYNCSIRKNTKIIYLEKHTSFCNEYEQRGLKNVDIFSKITSLTCSSVKRPYDDSFHVWKVIPLFLIKNQLAKIFLFHSNLIIKQKTVKKCPKFYQELLTRCGKYLYSPPKVLSVVAFEFIWYN